MQELLTKALNGDHAAQKQIFEYLRVRFHLLAKRRIGNADAEDIAQDACITVWEKYQNAPGPADFEAWAYQILRNKIGNYMQSRAVRQKTHATVESIEEFEGLQRLDVSPVLKQNLIRCLEKLMKVNIKYARVLNLVHQGYKTDEICQRLKVKQNHFYVLLNRSRTMLSECLGHRSPGE